MNDLDFFGYRREPDGTFSVLKNGELFLTCTGSETDAQNMVSLLQNDNQESPTKQIGE